jgi:hypothetical protein
VYAPLKKPVDSMEYAHMMSKSGSIRYGELCTKQRLFVMQVGAMSEVWLPVLTALTRPLPPHFPHPCPHSHSHPRPHPLPPLGDTGPHCR